MSASPALVLVVEDNPGDVRLLREMIDDQGPHNTRLIVVGSVAEAEAHLAGHAVDLILLDLHLPDAYGLDVLRRVHATAPRTPLVVLTGIDDQRLAARALKEGAQDYLIKGQIETRSLIRAMRYAAERKAMEEALFGEKERAEVTLNCIADAVACADMAGNITFLNRVAVAMTGWSVSEAIGQPMERVLRIEDAATRMVIANPMQRAMTSDRSGQLKPNCVLVRRDGTETAIEDSVAPIHNRQGQPSGAVIVFRDVGHARAMALEMSHSARHDFLTGLPNRMLLDDRINQAIVAAPRHNKKVAVLFLDLDGFKHINDTLGHPVGDKLLQSIAKRLVDCVRGADTVCRQGGDEFVVLLSEMQHSEDAANSARRVLEAVAAVHSIGSHELRITTSIGIAVYPDDGEDAQTLIKNADTAMYQAKESGRQTFRFFKPAMNVRAIERQTIEEDLRGALERQEFVLLYQPKVDIRSRRIVGTEALIRWNHPTRGLLSPSHFIPVAEGSGLIERIGEWVMRRACWQLRTWREDGLALDTIAVNVSGRQFRGENFLESVFTVLDESHLDPASLELELTESILITQTQSTASILAALRGKGVKVAVDDFGTGYSNLRLLRSLPIDTIKIDQSFIRQIGSEGDGATIVSAALGIARNLNLQVVAEGVETNAELEFLTLHDCDIAQGYLFSEPLPADQFAALLKLDPAGTLSAPEPDPRATTTYS